MEIERVNMKNLAPDITRKRFIIEGFYTSTIDEKVIEAFFAQICSTLNLKPKEFLAAQRAVHY